MGFARFREGFIVAYDVPNCDESGECGESLLGLQYFNEAFRPIGAPRIQSGMFVGVRDEKVHILQFERPLAVPLPDPPYRPRHLIISDW